MEFRTLEHTADVGVEVEADTLEELFTGAGRAMFSIMVDLETVSAVDVRSVSLSSTDLEELMFEWLNELNYLASAEDLLLSRFDVKRAGEKGLEAEVAGETIDPEKHFLMLEIKAATYHDMVVEKRDRGWYARVIFDV